MKSALNKNSLDQEITRIRAVQAQGLYIIS